MSTTLVRLDATPPSEPALPATETPRSYWSLSSGGWTRYIATHHDGARPEVLSTAQVLFVGVEQGIFSLGAADGSLIHAVTDADNFLSFTRLSDGTVIALAETGVYAFAASGAASWQTAMPEVLVDVRERQGHLILEGIKGDEFRLDAATGNVIRQ